MAVSPADELGGAERPSWPWLTLASDAILRTYAQILFSRSRRVGALLLLATALAPRVAVYGLAAVTLAFLVTRVFRLGDELTAEGSFGYNALLVGLGVGALFGPTPDAHVIAVVGVVTAVFMSAALYSALGATFALPPLTLPFLFVFYLVLGSARLLDVPLDPLLPDTPAFLAELPHPISLYLQSLGALFFLVRADVGALVLVAMLVHSRIAVLLSLLGFGAAYLVQGRLLLLIDGTLPMVLGYNFVLTAIALGGVWFVPSPASMLLALGGSLVCGLVAVGVVPSLTVQALPVLILPFNLTVILVLYAMRQRTRDGRPKAVDFAIGTPEQNLAYYRSHIARFGARYRTRFSAPFLGRWVCTQGVDGPHTHRKQWRHAFDFEVRGRDGKTFRGDGLRVRDYACFRLPVLAAADGTVVRVVDDVPDNPVGEPNLVDNWGNLVLLYHAPGLYSLVCHLARGSTKVREGQLVRRGDALGLCGSSGRSPVPHLHFQLQGTPTIGAPTLPTELHEVVLEDDAGARLHSTLVVQEGATVRNLEPSPGPERLGLPPPDGEPLTFQWDGSSRRETLVAEIDLLGARIIRSRSLEARAWYEHRHDYFRIFDATGDPGSVLYLLQAALPTVPFELGPGLRWSDHLELRAFLARPLRVLLDFVSPFFPRTALELEYAFEPAGSLIHVVGRSLRRGRDGAPWVRTRATIDPGRGLTCLELHVGRRHQVARRVDPDPTPPQEPS
ncbi:MAG: urea transporter [Myxococcales bacterium]|nr:urea transporter [Myxococcales bacterium]